MRNISKSLQLSRTLLSIQSDPCPVSWCCRIPKLHLNRGVRPPTNECPAYDIKQSGGEVPVMLELWGMWNTLSLPSHSDPH